MTVTLKEMKAAILKDSGWRKHNGQWDTAGYESDAEQSRLIKAARTWDGLAGVAPSGWMSAVCDRELPSARDSLAKLNIIVDCDDPKFRAGVERKMLERITSNKQ